MRSNGNIPGGVEFRWDGNRNAGLLVWEHGRGGIGAKTYEERAKDADAFIQRYTAWANGEGYYYRIEDEEGNDVDSCGGFDDSDYMLSQVAEHLDGKEFEVVGDAEYLEDDLREILKNKVSTPA